MAGSSIGKLFCVTTFGESHGAALGCIVDGCPAGVSVSTEKIQTALNRRKPGASISGKENIASTARRENDAVEILSGVFEGKTEGTPIALMIKNTAQKPNDYDAIKNLFRPGHADFTYFEKYGIRDYRGGGRASGRETASRVAAGAIAKAFLDTFGIKITAYTIAACGIFAKKRDMSAIENNIFRCPDESAGVEMEKKLREVRSQKNSTGGIVECTIENVPAGLGEPVFDKLDAELGKAILSIGAVKGIEFGLGFAAAGKYGSETNDAMFLKNGNVQFFSNNAGGILGGISSGADIVFRLPVKPVPSIFQKQKTVGFDGEHFFESSIEIEGRHDVCLCPRIVPVVEAMSAIVLADMMLRARSCRV